MPAGTDGVAVTGLIVRACTRSVVGSVAVAVVLGLGLSLGVPAAQAAPVAIRLIDPVRGWFSGQVFAETSAPASAFTCSYTIGTAPAASCDVDSDPRPATEWYLEVDAPLDTPQGTPVVLDLTATSAAGGETSTLRVTLRWDTVAPIARTGVSPLYSEGNAKTQTWATGDPGATGARSGVDLVGRGLFTKAVGATGFGVEPVGLDRDAPTSGRATTFLQPGTTACALVVVVDAAGNVGEAPDTLSEGMTNTTCTAAPLDDRALAGGWKRATNAGAANTTVSSAIARGATLTYPKVATEIVTVKAYRCSSCGGFEVRVGGLRIAAYSLRSARAGWVTVGFSARGLRTGALSLVALGSGPVSVDLVWAYTPFRDLAYGASTARAGLRRTTGPAPSR